MGAMGVQVGGVALGGSGRGSSLRGYGVSVDDMVCSTADRLDTMGSMVGERVWLHRGSGGGILESYGGMGYMEIMEN